VRARGRKDCPGDKGRIVLARRPKGTYHTFSPNIGQASCKYNPNGIHQIKSFVIHKIKAVRGHAPVRINHNIPTGPSNFPINPTAAIAQPRSGRRATSK
jgi:hypothetical protein